MKDYENSFLMARKGWNDSENLLVKSYANTIGYQFLMWNYF